jgi:hypothetical protein
MAVVLGVMRRTKRGSPDLDRFAADFRTGSTPWAGCRVCCPGWTRATG